MRRVALVPILLCALAAAEARAEPRLQRFQSRHYLIHTDMPRTEVVDFGRHMDEIFDQYAKRFSGFAPRATDAMPLYLLRNRADYEAMLAGHDIDATNSGGMFFIRPTVQGLATWTGDRSRSETLSVLQHEGFHQFAWNYLGHRLPLWLNEGLAQYFEDAILVNDRMSLGIANGIRIQRVREAILLGNAIPFKDVLKIDNDGWSETLSHDATASALIYAQSWSLTYFLIHGEDGRYQQPLQDYLRMLSRGRDPDRSFRAAFGFDGFGALEAQWRAFALAQRPDPVTATMERMAFLGTALKFISENQGPQISTFAELRHYLQAVQFTLTRTSYGVATEFSATDDDVFYFPRDNGTVGSFALLEPSRRDLPPRITAPGLHPEPTLVWSRDDRGELVQDIVYR